MDREKEKEKKRKKNGLAENRHYDKKNDIHYAFLDQLVLSGYFNASRTERKL